MLFLGKRNNPTSQAITIVHEFFGNDFGLINACFIKDEAKENFGFSADFNLIVEFEPRKEQHIVRLARQLQERTAPLTVSVFTLDQALRYVGEKNELLSQAFTTDAKRREIATDIVSQNVFVPIA